MSRWLRHHVVEAMPGHLVGWVVGGAILALSGISPDDWVAHLVRFTSEFVPKDWSAATSTLVARSSFAALGITVIAVSFKVAHRPKERPRHAADAAVPASLQVTAPPTLVLPEKASIVVLPFQNLSGEAEQEYFCDGIVEDITTALSRMKWLFVIARNSSFSYKGKSMDIKQVGRELGVRYVLEGSVRKSAGRVRITGQLIEAETGRDLWAERYERPLDDVFAIQDDVTLKVVRALEPNLRAAELDRIKRKRPENLHAYDLYLQALAASYSRTPDDHTKAIALAERVLALEPGYVGAHALLADAYRGRYLRGEGREADREAALRHARAELSGGCDDATALAMVGFVMFQLGGDIAGARDIFERALQISPSSPMALGFSAVMLARTGEPDLAIERAQQALRLSPFDPVALNPNLALSEAYFITARYEQAAEAARRGIDAQPTFGLGYALFAAALVRLGRVEEAKAAFARGPGAYPGIVRLGPSIQAAFQPIRAALSEAGISV